MQADLLAAGQAEPDMRGRNAWLKQMLDPPFHRQAR